MADPISANIGRILAESLFGGGSTLMQQLPMGTPPFNPNASPIGGGGGGGNLPDSKFLGAASIPTLNALGLSMGGGTGFGPSGRQINFQGGVPFEPNRRVQNLSAGLGALLNLAMLFKSAGMGGGPK